MTVIKMAKPPLTTITLLASELTDIIDCLISSADRAESLAYELKGFPKQMAVRARAARFYALANRLDDAAAAQNGPPRRTTPGSSSTKS